ncbi:MAG: endopeptidase La [Lachnospiraceae bacterium]|nr:endopeptidase La [Lachnospiraceae bacterium]
MSEVQKMMIPAIPLKNMCVVPDSIIHFDLSRKKSIASLEKAMSTDQELFLTAQKNPENNNPGLDDIYEIGTLVRVKQIVKMPNKIVRVLVEGVGRAKVVDFSSDPYFIAKIVLAKSEQQLEEDMPAATKEAMKRQICEMYLQYSLLVNKKDQGIVQHLSGIEQLGKLLDQITMLMPVDYKKKQTILEAIHLQKRFERLTELLQTESGILEVKNELAKKVKDRVEKNQREYVLKEQMKFIREELGDDSPLSDADMFREKLENINASEEVKSKIKKEIRRFEQVSQSSSESAVERTYLETVLDLPWDSMSEDNTDLDRAEEILKEDHYGLVKVKERILEYLAVRQLRGDAGSPIICLVGPPGTGKTSIARSMARAMNREYVRICLGGVRDEAEIRGHRKTYVGAMPGRIVTAVRQAGVKNPLILLDEIDKMSRDHKGDTASAMLEVLDSEQNEHFQDHYIEIPMDLSQIVFVATANDLQAIDGPLRDRMEVIEVTSYTANEKLHIAKEHLVKKQLKEHGIAKKQLNFTDKALEKIILGYTKEAGVRELERQIGKVCRKTAREILKEEKTKIKITIHNLEDYLGKEKYSQDKVNKKNDVGLVRGLAWTSVGGVTLEIEVNDMPGKGEMKLTGQLGDVMKESAMAGLSYVRSVASEYGITEEYFETHDLHIHIPEGAVPKDGPSAGITMATAMLSAVTGRKVKADLAMTGEVTLRGRVLAIGGLKEKLLAAKTAGIHNVLIPQENEKDLYEIDEEIKTGLNINCVSSMQEVLEYAFVAGKES